MRLTPVSTLLVASLVVSGLLGCGQEPEPLTEAQAIAKIKELGGKVTPLANGLRVVVLSNCDALTNVDGLQELTGVQDLNLSGCGALTNVDGLQGFTGLKTLDLNGCTALANVDGLQGLAEIEFLTLSECGALTNVDGRAFAAGVPEPRPGVC